MKEVIDVIEKIQAQHKEMWEAAYATTEGMPEYDNWLDKYTEMLDRYKNMPVLDLGCGEGNNARYLSERGFKTVCCDFSENALSHVKAHLSDVETCCFDLLDGIPFDDDFAGIVVADLCLHYFSESQTEKMLREIMRVIVPGGVLFCRVNSMKDSHYGAGKGREVERHFFEIESRCVKRFFDNEDISTFFGRYNILHRAEYEMGRYAKPKILWEIALQK